ncbi:hypothetical protein WR25_15920 [Diploscapter pachys]|uniref:Amiloride-sensitive sodium channel n=1 Tax=Diploscapter pachys TaxID=2018661 RepID=A0A2A2JMJ0_9BILA|nr:hypothetical protein WR25_15920 [Diploscapter pachys]
MSTLKVSDASYRGNPADMGRSFDRKSDKPKSCREAMCGKRTQRYMFFFIVVVLAILTIKDVIMLICEYFEYPKTTDMNIRFNETITMPNVTFCMSRTQAWSHFKVNESEASDVWDSIVDESFANMTDHDTALNVPWDPRLLMESYDLIASINLFEHFFQIGKIVFGRKLLKWKDFLESRNITYPELMQKVGHETVRRSIKQFKRTTYNEDLVIKTNIRITWISQMQICFKPEFDEKNFYPIKDPGMFFLMVLQHNSNNLEGQDLECMTADFHGRPSSIARFIEGKGAKDGLAEELCHGTRYEVKGEVRAHYEFLPNDDEGTKCREVENDDDDLIGCKLRCRLAMIQDICKCTPMSLAHMVKDEPKLELCDYTDCPLTQSIAYNNTYDDEPCKKECKRPCEQTHYEIKVQAKGRLTHPNLTWIELHWGSFEYLTLEQGWKWSLTEFISQLGGSIGMWLGLSILSLIQGSTYLYSYLKKNVVQEKILRKQTTVDSNGTRRLSRASSIGSAMNMNMGDFPTKTKYSLSANPLENPWTKKKSSFSGSRQRSFDSQRSSFDHEDGVNSNPNPTSIRVE